MAEQVEVRATLDVLAQLVEPLARALRAEVVVHDLTRLPNSVHAIAGGLTGRTAGAPATDLLLRHLNAGAVGNLIDYPTELPHDRRARSSTIIVRSPADGTPLAALCLNIDVTDLAEAHRLLGALLGENARPVHEPLETFPRSVGELTERMIAEALADTGVPVELMKKQHKIQVVARLREQGVFAVKDAVETVAEAIGVTRFTIYNYLNELEGEESA
ncbi:helix-turn-helix domain-containing protein [Nocardia sp. CDC159]|uniref:Helix-turn-helix domain-containing protein n=1 Tax=Nocardia pulmonis TaxID=2951408 RepID=A0A9X2IWB4_9NOCA|nr:MULTISPECIES: helix-turn-helix domain-containing protein [Nocardia]MCM6772660.1 helix-turn-helix domain-containing protein [Nocardia pulmonis]MCM6786037.1 helix-turn-helix domain-containing protein [Nocardia sp. CDC159]